METDDRFKTSPYRRHRNDVEAADSGDYEDEAAFQEAGKKKKDKFGTPTGTPSFCPPPPPRSAILQQPTADTVPSSGLPLYVPTDQDVNTLEALEKQAEELRKLKADDRARVDDVLNSLSTLVSLLIGFVMVFPPDNKFLTTTDPEKAMKLALIPVFGFMVAIAVSLHVTILKFKCLSEISPTRRCQQVKKFLKAVQRDFLRRGIIMPEEEPELKPSCPQVDIAMAPLATTRVANGLMNSAYHQRLVGVEDTLREISQGRTFSVSFYTIYFHLMVAIAIVIVVKVLGVFLLF